MKEAFSTFSQLATVSVSGEKVGDEFGLESYLTKLPLKTSHAVLAVPSAAKTANQ